MTPRPKPLPFLTTRQLADHLRECADLINTQADWLDDYHGYSQIFGFSPGSNVLLNVLTDALTFRGITLQQFREQWALRSPRGRMG